MGRGMKKIMRGNRQAKGSGFTPGGIAPALLLAGAVGGLALPSAVLAFSSGRIFVLPAQDAPTHEISVRDVIAAFSANQLDTAPAQALSHPITVTAPRGQMFRFTPAGSSNRPDRSVTVAVRVDAESANTITTNVAGGFNLSNHKPMETASLVAGLTPLGIAPTAYNLGVSRGYQNFAPVMPEAGTGTDLHKIDMPDLSTFKAGSSQGSQPSRFATRIALDQKDTPGKAPRTLEAPGLQTVDVGGSYRLTRNLNVTAGVRYSSERDRLMPLVDGQKDSQAVYLGTQFHF